MPFRNARIRATALLACAFVGSMLVTVSYAPTLYRLFCGATGYGGTTRRAIGQLTANVGQNPHGKQLRVYFDTNVANGLDWNFRPEKRYVDVTVGIPTTVYFDATNRSNQLDVARAVYNVAPPGIAPYFYKIQCFCFTQEKLNPKQTAQMPVVFYIDDSMMDDDNSKYLQEITLSYTFYRQNDLARSDVEAARDLKAGSVAESKQRIHAANTYDNDAVRRPEP